MSVTHFCLCLFDYEKHFFLSFACFLLNNGHLTKDIWILVDVEDTYVTLFAAFSNDFANNVFCNQW